MLNTRHFVDKYPSLSALGAFDVWELQYGLDVSGCVQGQVEGSCEHSNELTGAMNFGERCSCLALEIIFSQKDFCSMVLGEWMGWVDGWVRS